jgi:ParB-like chromosome segregation protein Spo0J
MSLERLPTRALKPHPWAYLFPATGYERNALASDIRDRGIVEPLHVRPTFENGYEVLSGCLRLEAAVAAGLKEVPVRVLHLDDDAALAHACAMNLGRVMDRSEIARRMLGRHPEWTDRRIAEMAGCTHPHVGKLRNQLAVDRAVRIGQDGRLNKHRVVDEWRAYWERLQREPPPDGTPPTAPERFHPVLRKHVRAINHLLKGANHEEDRGRESVCRRH